MKILLKVDMHILFRIKQKIPSGRSAPYQKRCFTFGRRSLKKNQILVDEYIASRISGYFFVIGKWRHE